MSGSVTVHQECARWQFVQPSALESHANFRCYHTREPGNTDQWAPPFHRPDRSESTYLAAITRTADPRGRGLLPATASSALERHQIMIFRPCNFGPCRDVLHRVGPRGGVRCGCLLRLRCRRRGYLPLGCIADLSFLCHGLAQRGVLVDPQEPEDQIQYTSQAQNKATRRRRYPMTSAYGKVKIVWTQIAGATLRVTLESRDGYAGKWCRPHTQDDLEKPADARRVAPQVAG